MKKIVDSEVVWGVIGAGDVCEKKSAPAMNKIPNSRIGAVMSRNEERIKDYASRHHIQKWYTDVDQLLNDPEINAIYISTPPISHAALAIKAAQAGKPVYVEKPMARTYAECMEMISVFTEADLPLYVAYYRRALPNFLKVKELIDNGEIGDVRTVSIEMYKASNTDTVAQTAHPWRLDPDVSGGGYFHDLASHQMDLMNFLLGPMHDAHGYSVNQSQSTKADDVTTGTFRFESGILGVGSWCFNASQASEKELTTIIGSKGKIEFATFDNTDVIVTTEQGRSTLQFTMPEHIQQPLIEQVVADLLGHGVCNSTAETGAKASWVLDKMTGAL
ncbi:Gfo/Idh/MocA family protein [Fulvivirga ligni]|uniref:Gfo/Idh/MocA family protein n=1 Tax=Fulvivirga ligni TaxID=2904246 RepID=UPI001F291921|nr:Gfo/Idh/MocA family oxidoreductase [Fulvivirga ligni]UII23424.1 Gfo/Idh/MocA family oxidoreductase [Fulvivirga ligni]